MVRIFITDLNHLDYNFCNVGTTSTLPLTNPEKFNIAFCSCSNISKAGF